MYSLILEFAPIAMATTFAMATVTTLLGNRGEC